MPRCGSADETMTQQTVTPQTVTQPTMNPAGNPLLDFSGLPRFDAIRPEHVVPAMQELIDSARATVESVVADTRPAAWDIVAEPLAMALDRLGRAWGAVNHLNSVVSNAQWREAYHAAMAQASGLCREITSSMPRQI